MKRVLKFLAIAITLTSSVLFCACSKPYKKLKMEFVGERGYVQLIMDNDYNLSLEENERKSSLSAQMIEIKFSGIKSKNIGKIDVSCEPNDLVEIGEIQIIDGSVYFPLYSNKVGTGVISVTHSASGKQITVPLYVDEKAVMAESLNNTLVVDIPDESKIEGEENYNYFAIDNSELLKFTPSEASDNVIWNLVSGESVFEGVTIINTLQDENFAELINNDETVLKSLFGENYNAENLLHKNSTIIKVASSCNGGNFKITPTLSMDTNFDDETGRYYKDIALEDVQIEVAITDVLTAENIKLYSTNAVGKYESKDLSGTAYREVTGKAYLFHNTTELNMVDVYLFKDEQNIFNTNGISYYKEIYQNLVCSSLIQADFDDSENANFKFTSTAFSAGENVVNFNFFPKNAVGDIKAFTKTLKFELTEVADSIRAKVGDGEDYEKSYIDGDIRQIDVTILDYYNLVKGQLFNFDLLRTTTDDSMQKFKIVVDPSLLSLNNGNTSTTLNEYLLEFYKGSKNLMSFTYNDATNLYESSEFSKYDSIYVKYVTTINELINAGKIESSSDLNLYELTSSPLYFDVKNVYDSDYYGENSALEESCKTLRVNANRQKGVKAIEMYPSWVEFGSESTHLEVNTDTEDKDVINNAINIPNSSLTNYSSSNRYNRYYGIEIRSLKDFSNSSILDSEVKNIEFNTYITKNGNVVDCFDYYLYWTNYNGINDDSISQIENKLELSEFSSKSDKTNYPIIFIAKKDSTTIENGEYKLFIEQVEGDFSQSFSFNVFINITNENTNNIEIYPFNESGLKQELGVYKGLYDVENKTKVDSALNSYIVPTNSSYDVNIMFGSFIGEKFEEDKTMLPFVTSISVETSIGTINNDEFIQDETLSAGNYLSYSYKTNSNNLSLNWSISTKNNGSIKNESCYYVKLDFIFTTLSYEYDNATNFYKEAKEPTEIRMSYYLFIYEPISNYFISNENGQKIEEINPFYIYADSEHSNQNLGYYYLGEATEILYLNVNGSKITNNYNIFNYFNYEWKIGQSLGSGINKVENANDHSVIYKFDYNTGKTGYISCVLTQFGISRTVNCFVNIQDIDITDNIVVNNKLNTIKESDKTVQYLTVKAGDTNDFKFDVKQLGSYSFGGIKYVVCDMLGNLYTGFSIDDNGNIVGNDVKAGDYTVLIFAKDWLKKAVDETNANYYFDFSNLREYLVAGVQTNQVKQVVLKVRDGSSEHPFLISTKQELKDIATGENYYYELTNDINMNNEEVNLGNLRCSLSSYSSYSLLNSEPSDWDNNLGNYYTYNAINGYVKLSEQPAYFRFNTYYEKITEQFTIYNIKFKSSDKNCSFISSVGENATIKNITFKYSLNGDLTATNIGLIGENKGTLENLTVEYNFEYNNVNINVTAENIGLLVAVNRGKIKYSDSSLIASSGTVNITVAGIFTQDTKNKNTNIGGLVGKNVGTIEGVLASSSSKDIEYVIFYEDQGALYNGNITVGFGDKIDNANKNLVRLGGVAGLNYGTILNAYTSGSVKGYNNVGGIVGYSDSLGHQLDEGEIYGSYTSGLYEKIDDEVVELKQSEFDSSKTYYKIELVDLTSLVNSADTDKPQSLQEDKLNVVTIYNSQSTTKVEGRNNVGGVVGLDNYGLYYHVYYEVYNNNTTKASVTGNNYVGGLIGKSTLGKLDYCYFHSFRWNYNGNSTIDYIDSEFNGKTADILQENYVNGKETETASDYYVGGLIGYADSLNANSYNNEFDRVRIENSSMDAFVSSENSVTAICYAYGIPYFNNITAKGCVYGDKDETLYVINGFYKTGDIVTKLNNDSLENYLNYYINVYGNDFDEDYNKIFKKYYSLGSSFDEITYNDSPLVTVAPTSINLSGAITDLNEKGTNDFIDETGTVVNIDKVIVLYYYDLINSNSENYSNDKNTINTISLDDFIIKNNIKIEPNGAGGRFKITTSDSSIITILSNGGIVLKGEGQVTLTFTSIINSSVCDKITIIVTKMPTNFNIYSSSVMNTGYELEKINIIKGESKFVYDKFTGEIIVNNTIYNYTVTTNTLIDASINLNGNANDGNITINDNQLTESEILTLKDYSSLVLSVENYVENDYEITFIPYAYFEFDGALYRVALDNDEQERTFTLSTKQGVIAINTNVTNTIMSVIDELNLEVEIDTDSQVDSLNAYVDVRYQDGSVATLKDEKGEEIAENVLFNTGKEDNAFDTTSGKLLFKLDSSEFDDVANTQTQEFVLRLNEKLRVEKDLFVTLTLYQNDASVEISFVLIPQEINSVVASSYKDSNESGWEKRSVIRPGEPSMIVIDIAPTNAYFEYLEITDLSVNDKIKFTQFDSFNSTESGFGNSKALSQMDKMSSDGYGIQLQKVDGNTSFYVYTLLDVTARYNTGHRIQITAYSSTGYELGSTVLTLDAVMFPYIQLDYYNAKEKVVTSSNSLSVININSTDLAIGVEAKIKATTRDTDGLISWEIYDNYDSLEISNYIDIVPGTDGYYYLTYKDEAFNDDGSMVDELSGFIGKTIGVKATVQKQLNGIVETSVTTLEFVLRKYTLNGISMTTDKLTTNGRLGAVLGQEHTLEVYFDTTDISFYSNGKYFDSGYWNKTFKLSDITNLKSKDDWDSSIECEIYNLLTELNSIAKDDIVKLNLTISNKDYTVSWKVSTNSDYSYVYEDISSYLTLRQKDEKYELTVNSISVNNGSLDIEFNYYYDNTGIVQLGTATDSETSEAKKYSNSFIFNIANVSTLFDYIPIKNAEEFNDMVEGGYYILTNDIVLNDYEMLDLNLGGFDGNGYSITITSFDYEAMARKNTDQIGYFGLFKEIYQGEIIQNLKLIYNMSYTIDLCEYPISNGTYYSTIYYGGIAGLNNGIITNCELTGSFTLQTTQISPSKFFVGGVCSTNGATGYITNTICDINISTGGIVGGFVVQNEGTIVSSKYTNSIINYVATESGYTDTIVMAGFAVYNNGKISLSTVSPASEKLAFRTGGSVAGFVYENGSGAEIYDCYLKDVTFSTSGSLGGFVHTNAGSISRCYINVSIPNIDEDRTKAIFVRTNNSSDIENCYYITDSSIESNIAGVKRIGSINLNNQSSFNGFIFTTNENGVWYMTTSGPILLNNNLEITFAHKTVQTVIENNEEKQIFIVAGTKEIPYVIYNVETYEYYMAQHDDQVLFGYYRIVADIDFGGESNPISSNYTFSGMLEGNNMTISNFGLFSQDETESLALGLFKTIKQNDQNTGFVNNLTLSAERVRGANSQAVGVLAGIIESGKIYNINIDNNSLVVVGKNSVGGLAGVIKGSFDINGVVSNVGVRSTYRNAGSRVIIYLGRDVTLSNENNLSMTSYAGAIAGIIEGYGLQTSTKTTLSSYSNINNVTVNSSNILIGETVGGIAGLLTKYTHLSNATFNFDNSTHITAVYYAGGLVGENRGIISNSSVLGDSTIMSMYYNIDTSNSSVATAGIVAVNHGGLLYNVYNQSNVVNYNKLGVAGGIVARNVNGVIVSPKNEGFVYSLIIGGIVGADYSYDTIKDVTSHSGSVSNACLSAIPTDIVDYSNINLGTISKAEKYQGINIGELDNWFDVEKTNLSLLNRDISNYYEIAFGSEVGKSSHYFRGFLGAIICATDAKSYVSTFDATNKISIKLVYDDGKDTEFYDNLSNIFIDNRKTEAGDGEYSLVEKIYNASNRDELKENYYYLIPILSSSYDSPSLSQGYSVGVVKIIGEIQ